MSFIGGLLGGSSGAGYQAQTNTPAIAQANQGVNNAISQQQNFVNALTGTQGLQNQQNVFGQQQGLANQLQGVANGTGPNPAMAALNQATGQNVAAQAALMAGQRGSSQNAGLMARQAAQQGAATQQQAVGQGATMQAQQSLGAMQQLGAQQAQMGNIASQQVNQQQVGQQNLSQANLQNQSNTMGLQQNANSANAGVAQGNAQMQGNILGNLAGGVGSAAMLMNAAPLALADGGEARKGYANPSDFVSPTDSAPVMAAPAVTPQPAPTVSQGPRSTIGQHFQANTSGFGTLGSAIGQGIKSLFNSNQDTPGADKAFAAFDAAPSGPTVTSQDMGSNNTYMNTPGGAQDVTDQTSFAKGGKVPALVSPGEIRIHKKDVKKVAEGKKSPLSGEKIPGKPRHPGNDYRNDIVPKTLSEGDIIIPNSVMQSKNPHWAAHKFVSDIMAGKHKGKK